MKDLKDFIRDVPDFPKEGIIFKDITTLLKNSEALSIAIDQLYDKVKEMKIDKVIGIESRGFIFAPVIAYKLNAGFIPVRKPGKLPAEVVSESYELEYGTDTLEMHKDAIEKGDKVLIADDLIATGGTAKAVCKMVEKMGGEVVALEFLIELEFLKGREKLEKYNLISLIKY
jgi:adenine phosphoribosyltransferase